MANYAIWLKHGTRSQLPAHPLHQAEPYMATDANDQTLLVGIGDGNNIELLSKSKYATGSGSNTNTVDHAIHADTVDNATNANHATMADSATTAGHATTADSASAAGEATHAANSDSATSAATASSLTSDAIAGIIRTIFPVGSLKFETSNINPGTYIPNTTWAAWGVGKVPVGVDSSQTDFNAAEKTGGEKKHTLVANELPITQSVPYGTATSNGQSCIASSSVYTNGARTGFTEMTVNLTGGQPHENMPPFETCYMWKRVA